MDYCTLAKLVELFGEPEIIALSRLHDPAGMTIDTVRVNAAIAYAEDEINSYIGLRYTSPFTSVPIVLGGKAADIARYQLDSIHPREDVRKRYEDAIKWLILVASGKIDLSLGAGSLTQLPITPGTGSVGSLIPDQVFDLRGY